MTTTLVRWAAHLLFVSFLVAGIVCAGVSAGVEYAVLSSFYETGLFAALSMAALESAKLFLVFFNCQYTSVNDSKYMRVRRIFLPIRYALVTFSFVAMLLWTLYHLSNPNADAQLEKKYTELDTQNTRQVELINTNFEKRKTDQFNLDQVEVALWHQQMNFEMNNIVGRTWEGPYFNSHRARWEAALKAQSEAQQKLEQERLTAVAAEFEKLRQERVVAKTQILSDPASRNQLLSRALQPIVGNDDVFWYPLGAILFSMMVTVGLEGTIWIWATVVAITVGDSLTESLKLNELADKYASVTRAGDRVAEEKVKEFQRRVVREKNSILSTFRNLF